MKQTVNQMRNQILSAGYFFSVTQKKNEVYGFLHSDNAIGKCFYSGSNKFKNLTEFFNWMLDKIGELGISGKYLTNEMIKDE